MSDRGSPFPQDYTMSEGKGKTSWMDLKLLPFFLYSFSHSVRFFLSPHSLLPLTVFRFMDFRCVLRRKEDWKHVSFFASSFRFNNFEENKKENKKTNKKKNKKIGEKKETQTRGNKRQERRDTRGMTCEVR